MDAHRSYGGSWFQKSLTQFCKPRQSVLTTVHPLDAPRCERMLQHMVMECKLLHRSRLRAAKASDTLPGRGRRRAGSCPGSER